ncbi:MAG: LptF/LptG family permease [Spirochaetes bacterium]|nr:LptF/LptG family permease [Spirochaetota bacterium]MBU0955378.1 LptF/LptG family permease [Spirochaetota bacterium]
MPESVVKSKLLLISLLLLLLAFAAGIIQAVIGLQTNGILSRFAFFWTMASGLLMLAQLTPAILLVAASTSGEMADEKNSYTVNAMQTLLPALILAGLVSIFYLLLVPQLQARRNLYLETSKLFTQSLQAGRLATQEGRLQEARQLLLVSRAIDIDNKDYLKADEKLQAALIQDAQQQLELQQSLPPVQVQDNDNWESGNDFYLQAQQALADERYFDAYFLARQSVAMYPHRQEIRNFVTEVWNLLQNSGPPAARKAEAELYERKVAAYKLLLDRNYLAAYRAFLLLSAEAPQDIDIQNYLKRSQESLAELYFFTEDLERAFRQHRPLPFHLVVTDDENRHELTAEKAVATLDGVYFQGLEYRQSGSTTIALSSPYGRLAGNTLIPRAVNRADPGEVYNENWQAGSHSDMTSLSALPFDDTAAREVLIFTENPRDIPLHTLVANLPKAEKLGVDPVPLRRELAARMAYPFATIMLVLLGTAIGMRFRANKRPGPLAILFGSPVLVLLALLPVELFKALGLMLAELAAQYTGNTTFTLAWLSILAVFTILSLLVSARIASYQNS